MLKFGTIVDWMKTCDWFFFQTLHFWTCGTFFT